MTAFWHDLRYAFRQLYKHLSFSSIAVITLAIGIASATSVFSLVDAVLLRPLPYPKPEQVVALSTTLAARSDRAAQNRVDQTTCWPDFFDWRSGTHSFSAMVGYEVLNGNIGRSGTTVRRVAGTAMSSGMARVLGVSMLKGRDFQPEEELSGNRSIILSYPLWQSEFAGASDVLGRHITINEESYTVVGVLPRSFTFPEATESLFWVTEAHSREGQNPPAQQRGVHSMSVLARLRDGVSPEQGYEDVNRIQHALAIQYPDTDSVNPSVAVLPLASKLTGEVQQPLRIMLAAVGFLVLIGCVNVAGLLLTRSTARQGELAIRAALGASRIEILRQILLESVVLSLAGGALGTALAGGILRLAPRYLPMGLSHAEHIGLNASVLCFSLAASIITGLFFGVAPAWSASRLQPSRILVGRGSTSGRKRFQLHGSLVIAETAVSLLLLVGAGLLLRSFERVISIDPGFKPEGLLTFSVAAPDKHFTNEQEIQFARLLQSRLASSSGLTAATYSFPMPFAGGDLAVGFNVVGHPTARSQQPLSRVSTVASNFFSVMKIPIVKGRAFTEAEDQPKGRLVTLVNEAFAKRYFPGEDALGKHINSSFGPNDTQVKNDFEIIGIVGDTKRVSLTEDTQPQFYLPYSQVAFGVPPFAIRVQGNPMEYVDVVRRAVAEQDSNLPVFNVYSYETLMERNTALRRFQIIVIAGFAAVSLMLAALGLYVSLSYMVMERIPELGLRLALGARRIDLLGLVMRRGMSLAAIGLAVGLLASAALTRYLQSLLYATRSLDALTFAMTAALLFVVCMAASFTPAWRASRLDPSETLRQR